MTPRPHFDRAPRGAMDERDLRRWVDRVKDGTISRRQFTRLMVGAGLTAPLAALL